MPELHEELSIDIGNSQPWLTRTFHYPHAIAHLPLFRVTRWQGEPHGRENQRLSWQDPHHIDIGPLLPANHDIMNALRLPPMSAITQAGKLGIDIFMLRLRTALQNGVRLVQVREKEMDAYTLHRLVLDVTRICHSHHARVMVNGDINLARTTGADGIDVQNGQFIDLDSPPVAGMLWPASHPVTTMMICSGPPGWARISPYCRLFCRCRHTPGPRRWAGTNSQRPAGACRCRYIP